jgi:Tfp pilus assembly protein PilE
MKIRSLSALKHRTLDELAKNKSGMTLVEVMIVFAVALTMVGFAYAMYNYLSGSSETSQTQQSVAALRMGIKGIYSSQSSYTGLNNAMVINSQAAPQNLIKGNQLSSPLGGAITVSSGSGGSTFSIALAGLDQKACVFLATNQTDGWHQIQVNGTTLNKAAAVAGATAGCTDTGNTVTFISR